MNFEEENAKDWIAIINKVFPFAIPQRCEWHDLSVINNILQIISAPTDSNHTFFPSGGGLDLEGSELSKSENGFIELMFRPAYICKPKRLMFESFGSDMQWSYFRLELETIEPIQEGGDGYDEQLVELSQGEYISGSYADADEYQGEKMPKSARVIIRLLKGALVIFQKTSTYNAGHGELDAYDGRHDKMSADEFRNYIEKYMKAYERAIK